MAVYDPNFFNLPQRSALALTDKIFCSKNGNEGNNNAGAQWMYISTLKSYLNPNNIQNIGTNARGTKYYGAVNYQTVTDSYRDTYYLPGLAGNPQTGYTTSMDLGADISYAPLP
jgi:hypothetical protein